MGVLIVASFFLTSQLASDQKRDASRFENIKIMSFKSETAYIAATCFSPDGSRFFVSDRNWQLRAYDWKNNDLSLVAMRSFDGANGDAIFYKLSPHKDNKTMAVWGRYASSVDFYEAEGNKFERLPGSLDYEKTDAKKYQAVRFAFSKDGTSLFYVPFQDASDGIIEVWPFPVRKNAKAIRLAGKNPVSEIALSRDGETIAAVSENRYLSFWKTKDTKQGRPFRVQRLDRSMAEGQSLEMAFSTDGKRAALVYTADWSWKFGVYTCDIAQGNGKCHLFPNRGRAEKYRSASFLNDLSFVCVGDHDGLVTIWDLTSHRKIRSWDFKSYVTSMAMTNDQRILAVSCWDGMVHMLFLK